MNWLPDFLDTCRRAHLCMNRYCTTCGGGVFLERLRDRAAAAGEAADENRNYGEIDFFGFARPRACDDGGLPANASAPASFS